MRASQIAVLAAAGALVGGMLVVAVAGRVGLGSAAAGERVELGERVTREWPLDDFTAVVVRGAWTIDLEQGDAFRVELEYPEGIEERLEVEVRGGRLVLDSEDRGRPRWGWFGGEHLDLTARIVMPSLTGVEIAGSGDLHLAGFSGERLALEVAGAANVETGAGRYDALDLDVSGAGRVEMSEMVFRDAAVNLSGAADVVLRMSGGVLSGSLSGVGNIRYHGTVSAERVNVSGFGRVEPIN
jgi:hypothetical protein